MINGYQAVSRFSLAGGVAVGLALTTAAESWLDNKNASAGVMFGAGLLLTVVSVLAVTRVVEMLVQHNPSLRRFLMGRQWVEGAWIDVVRYQDRASVIGICRFDADGDGLRFSGENFSLNGDSVVSSGTFQTDGVSVVWPMVRFTYQAREDRPPVAGSGESAPPAFLAGFGEITFQECDGTPPLLYRGRCVDVEQGFHLIEGYRVPHDEAKLLDTPEGRLQAARAGAARFNAFTSSSDLSRHN